MQSILDAINKWIKEILIGAINGNLSNSMIIADNLHSAIFSLAAYSGALAKSIFSAH